MPLVIYGSAFAAAAVLGWALYPIFEQSSEKYVSKRAAQAQGELDDIFLDVPIERIRIAYFLLPTILAALGYIAVGRTFAAVTGAIVGLIIPRIFLKFIKKRRERRFEKMLVDSLLLLSSCLRAGLSLLQGFQVVVEEMGPPISQEMGLMLKEMKMGVSFEEAIRHFQKRNPIEETNLFVTAVLVARETGGDVTTIFTQLVSTMRERRKIKEKITTLTFMSRAQGFLMALLPLGFLAFTWTTNPQHTMYFVNDPLGRMMAVLVIALQAFGMFLFWMFSRSPM